jgi:ATP-dependent Clp protease ATP-binding subunit ClpB
MTQTIIVLTSNLLSQIPNLNSKNALQIKEQVEATKVFRPELLGRINEILVFNSLSKDVIREILQRRIDLSLWNLSDRGINVSISSEEIDAMILEVEAAKFGVRQIDDVVRSHIRKLISV